MKFIEQSLLILGVIISFAILTVNGQDVCVISEKKVSNFAGSVKQFDGQFIPEAFVKVYQKGTNEKLIAETKTSTDGHFEIGNLVQGKYIVKVSYPNFVTLVFPIKITKAKKLSQKLIIILGWDYDKSCGGGEVIVN